jgi:hypothetical protein
MEWAAPLSWPQSRGRATLLSVGESEWVVRRRMETIVHARTGVGTACRAPRYVPARRFLRACVCVRSRARACCACGGTEGNQNLDSHCTPADDASQV